MSTQKILVIRLSSIGDILLTTPFIRQIKKKFPDSEIDFVVKSGYEDLIKYNPYLEKIHTFESSSRHALRNLKACLKGKKYDYIFDLHNNFRSNFLRLALYGTHKGIIKKDKLRQLMLLYIKLNLYKRPKSIPQRYLETGLKAGIKDDHEGLDLFWTEKESKKADLILKKLDFEKDEPFICLAPGSGFFTKRWPREYFAELIQLIHRQLKLKIVILGGVGDEDVTTQLSSNDRVYGLAGQLSLLESAAVLSNGAALVGNDTGLMHMAAAVKIPVVAIFGSSVVEWGFEPFRVKHVLVEEKGLYCRPCSHIGRNSCPKKHFKCMMNITPERVFEALKKLFQNRVDLR